MQFPIELAINTYVDYNFPSQIACHTKQAIRYVNKLI